MNPADSWDVPTEPISIIAADELSALTSP